MQNEETRLGARREKGEGPREGMGGIVSEISCRYGRMTVCKPKTQAGGRN